MQHLVIPQYSSSSLLLILGVNISMRGNDRLWNLSVLSTELWISASLDPASTFQLRHLSKMSICGSRNPSFCLIFY